MSKEENIEEKELLTLFDVSPSAILKYLKGIECSFYIKIYSEEELQEIKQKVQEEIQLFPNLNGNMLQFIKEKYRISSKDLRKFLKAEYYKYRKAEMQNTYIKLKRNTQNQQKRAQIIKKWKNKDSITSKSIKNIIDENNMSFEEIGEIFEISKRELTQLKSGKIKKVNIDLYTEKEKRECRRKIDNCKKYKISKKVIEDFAQKENVSLQKAGEILGINKSKLRNIIEQKQLTTKIKDERLKRQVDKIALDIKYLPNNGERYYKNDETNFMSIFYRVRPEDIFYYLATGKTEYETYQEALKNNPKGVWIGKKGRLSNDYIERNYETLLKMIKQTANNVAYNYGCSDFDKDDFISEAFEYIVKNGGFYEKNLYYDEEKLNLALTKNVAYIMKLYYSKQPKHFGFTNYYQGIEYENEEILRDDRYDPEVYLLEERYSYLKEIEPLHQEIAKEISINDNFVIKFPTKFFSKLARKYQMKNQEIEEIMGEIRTFILKKHLAKITKDGKIIPRFYIDD